MGAAMNDTKLVEAEPASTSESAVGAMDTYIDPVKEAKMMRKFDVRCLPAHAFCINATGALSSSGH